jgi:hypothetical protein
MESVAKLKLVCELGVSGSGYVVAEEIYTKTFAIIFKVRRRIDNQNNFRFSYKIAKLTIKK